jgi:putative phosphoesterase
MRIAILSDIHGNHIAFNAVISDIKSLDISEIVFLGDLVVKGPSPLEVFNILKDLKPLCWIKGNTDTWFAEINDSWIPTTDQEKEIYRDFIYTRDHLNKESIEFLLKLPEKCSFERIGVSILAVHGSPRSISEDIGKGVPYNDLEAIFSNTKESIILCGHTHIPFIGNISGKTIFNVGSIGMPSDGINKASYGILEIENSPPKCIVRKVSYSIKETLRIAKNRNLPNIDKYRRILKEARLPSQTQ